MTTAEIRTKLQERINHLNDTQLQELDQLFEERFPENQKLTKVAEKRKLGTMKGKIWMANDWDSNEINEEVSRTFYEGDIFPKHK